MWQDCSAPTDQCEGALIQDVSRQELDVDDDHVGLLSPPLVPATVTQRCDPHVLSGCLGV